MIGNASRPRLPSEASSRRKSRSSCSTGTSRALLVHEVDPLRGRVEDGAEVGADRLDQPLRLPHRLGERRPLPCLAPLAHVRVRGHRLDVERAQHVREHERGRRVTRSRPRCGSGACGSPRTSSVASRSCDVGLRGPRRVGDLPHLVPGGTPELLAREVLLDLLHERRRRRGARRLEDPDLEHLGVARARLDVDAGVEALRLQEMPVDGRRHHAGGRRRGRPRS